MACGRGLGGSRNAFLAILCLYFSHRARFDLSAILAQVRLERPTCSGTRTAARTRSWTPPGACTVGMVGASSANGTVCPQATPKEVAGSFPWGGQCPMAWRPRRSRASCPLPLGHRHGPVRGVAPRALWGAPRPRRGRCMVAQCGDRAREPSGSAPPERPAAGGVAVGTAGGCRPAPPGGGGGMRVPWGGPGTRAIDRGCGEAVGVRGVEPVDLRRW